MNGEAEQKDEFINQLLWPFRNLPDTYVVVDTETTGLFDEEGAPGIVSLGVAVVCNGKIANTDEYKVRPHRPMTDDAFQINGISDERVQFHPPFKAHWPKIRKRLDGALIVIHNAIFDWTLIVDHIARYDVEAPSVMGVFCSQRAAQPWAMAMGLKCSVRGPSLDTLTEALGVDNFRFEQGGIHSAAMDAKQTAKIVETLRRF